MQLIIDQDSLQTWLASPELHSSSEPIQMIYDGLGISWGTTKKFFSTFSYPSLSELHLINIGSTTKPCCLTNLLKNLTLEKLVISHCHLKTFSSLKKKSQLQTLELNHVTLELESPKLILPKKCQYLTMRNSMTVQLGKRKALKELHLFSTPLVMFQPESYPDLRSLSWCHTPLKTLRLEQWPKLDSLTVVDAGLEELILPAFHPIKHLDLTCNNLKQLDLSRVYDLKTINVHSNKLSMLIGTEINKRLTQIDCTCNKLGNLVVSGLAELDSLRCTRNKLRELDLTGTDSLKEINHDDGVYVILA